jgi:magnesium-protoporphyrin O-methyltransferase
MTNCCDATNAHFGGKHARRDLARYLSAGPSATAQIIVSGLKSLGQEGATLLDVGAGIGAIHHELVPEICDRAYHVDMSAAYIRSAREESVRRGQSDRVTFIHGDLVESANDLPEVDFVTLDRVVCCYPDYGSLLEIAAGKARTAVALSFPMERWYVRLAFQWFRLRHLVKREAFRSFIHPIADVKKRIEDQGFREHDVQDGTFWRTVLYVRPERD